MKSIETFNRHLNRRNYYNDAISKDYKNQIELLLKSTFSRLESREKLVIIGAGNLSDFSLDFFLRFFDKVVLTDVDIDSVTDAVRYLRLPNKLKQRVECRRIEYTGFEKNEFFKDFKERLVNCHTTEKIKQVLDSKLLGLYKYKFLKNDNDIDFIFVSPIYTQLVFHQVEVECNKLKENGFAPHLVSFIKEYMLDEMVNVIERFNNVLVNKLKKNGLLFVLSDIFQLRTDSGFYRRVKNSIKNYTVMEELYVGYKEKYGMGLGDYGLYNLDEKLKSDVSRWLIWPFDRESSFVVKLKIYSK